jgi:hypothetical protein
LPAFSCRVSPRKTGGDKTVCDSFYLHLTTASHRGSAPAPRRGLFSAFLRRFPRRRGTLRAAPMPPTRPSDTRAGRFPGTMRSEGALRMRNRSRRMRSRDLAGPASARGDTGPEKIRLALARRPVLGTGK